MSEKSYGIILRDNIMRLFGSLSGERIIYVSAPAGYGKTTAVRQWLDGDSRAKAVISLDERDNSPDVFCGRFCAALQSCQPKNKALAEIVSHSAFDGAPDEFTLQAIAVLSTREHSVLVFDDLHYITDERVLRFILISLSRLPENFQIILVSRHDLPPGFSDLWIKGRLAKISEERLLFATKEIVLLYKKHGKLLTEGEAAEIYRFTGGWAMGINALLLSGGKPSGNNLETLEQFILHNVWERWDEATREFMLKTSVARDLTPALCAALTGEQNCESILRGLLAQNAFVSSTEKGHYQYHRLFRDFLQRMMKERGNDLFLAQWYKLGKWHLSQENFYNAIQCFIICESIEGISESFGLLVSNGHEYFDIEKMVAVAHIPLIDEVAKTFPYIYSTLSWAAFNEGRASDMARYTDLYYENQHEIARLDPRLQLNIILLRLIDFRIPFHDLIQVPDSAPANLPAEDFGGMGVSLGIINQNMPLLHQGTRDFSECAIGDVERNIDAAKAALGGFFGNGATLLAECLMAGLLYEQGELDKAYGHALAANAEINDTSSSEAKFYAMSILIYVLDALGKEDEAEQIIARLASAIEKDRAYYLNYNFHSLISRRKLSHGDIKAAEEWLSGYQDALYADLSFYKLYIIASTCRAHITLGNYDAAITLLTKILGLAEAYNRQLGIIEAKILLAIACWKKKRGFQDEAMRHLREAVSLAYRYKYTQMFANEGGELTGMLRRLQKSAEQRGNADIVPASFVKMLYLKALEHQDKGLTSGQAEQYVKYTEKQKAIMKLICEGKSYSEITGIIGIKLPTLRSHISLIYKKLDVTSEADAIKKINSSGILTDSK